MIGTRSLITYSRRSALIAITTGLLGGALAMAQTAGTLDTKFGKGGTVSTIFSGQSITPIGAVELANGDIVVFSEASLNSELVAYTQFALTRYTSAGVLDTTFGSKGTLLTAFSNFSFTPFAFVLEPDGKFLVGGEVTGSTATAPVNGFGLAQVTANGELDTTFGTGGVASAQVLDQACQPLTMMLQPNGQILIAGFQPGTKLHGGGGTGFGRFNANGTLDTTFGTAGAALATTGLLTPTALALLSNGNYLVVGQPGSGGVASISEISSTGVLETSTSTAAITATSPLQGLQVLPTAFESDGDFVVASEEAVKQNIRSFVVPFQFSETGVQNTAFANPEITFNGETHSTGTAIAVQSNGEVIIGGSGLARLTTAGALDTTFATTGSFVTTLPVNALLLEANGDILALEAPATPGHVQDGITLQRYLGN